MPRLQVPGLSLVWRAVHLDLDRAGVAAAGLHSVETQRVSGELHREGVGLTGVGQAKGAEGLTLVGGDGEADSSLSDSSGLWATGSSVRFTSVGLRTVLSSRCKRGLRA